MLVNESRVVKGHTQVDREADMGPVCSGQPHRGASEVGVLGQIARGDQQRVHSGGSQHLALPIDVLWHPLASSFLHDELPSVDQHYH